MTSEILEKVQNILDPSYKVRNWKPTKKALKKKLQSLQIKNLTLNHRKWTDEENLKYIEFLLKYKKNFQSKDKNKKYRIFNKMALFIRTRNILQCRTHHRKMLKYYKTIDGIVDYLNKDNYTQTQLNSQEMNESKTNEIQKYNSIVKVQQQQDKIEQFENFQNNEYSEINYQMLNFLGEQSQFQGLKEENNTIQQWIGQMLQKTMY